MTINMIDSEQLTSGGMKSVANPIISIVMPALNEEEGIAKTISAIPKEELGEMGYEAEILVVDNGSTDQTGKVARQHGAKVIYEPRRGYGRAYKTGFEYAQGSIIVTADADMTYPVEGIPELVNALEKEDLDFITTNRFAYIKNGSMSLQHRCGNSILSLTTRLLFRINLNDSQSGMWVFRRGLLSNLTLQSDSMAFSQELKIEACHFAKCRWKEIPIEYRDRMGDAKLRSWRDGFGNLFRLMTKRIARRSVPATVTSVIAEVDNKAMTLSRNMFPNEPSDA